MSDLHREIEPYELVTRAGWPVTPGARLLIEKLVVSADNLPSALPCE
jgi:hypothetical protein